jgi:hypothetical protein
MSTPTSGSVRTAYTFRETDCNFTRIVSRSQPLGKFGACKTANLRADFHALDREVRGIPVKSIRAD